MHPFISHHDLWPVVTMKVTIGHIYKFYEKHIFSVSFEHEFLLSIY